MKKAAPFFFFLFILLILSGCKAPIDEGPGLYDDFAQCIYDSGLRMYGSMTCSICARQRDLFGSSFQYIQEIECHPRGENPQTELCFEKDIKGTPTWILEKDGAETARYEGYQNLEKLSEISGCTLT